MDSIVSYVDFAARQGFDSLPVNELDLALFGQLAYLPLAPAFMDQAALSVSEAVAFLGWPNQPGKRLAMAQAMAKSPRFSGLTLSNYTQDPAALGQRQFCALTIVLPDLSRVVTYRGTDRSLAGWRENFAMSFESPLTTQVAAVDYLHEAARWNPCPLWLAGHSKGGNLAVWAGAFCDQAVQERIQGIYTFDGPGLGDAAVDTPAYRLVSGRIRSFLPQDSLVGILLNYHKPYQVVNSTARGIQQHDVFTWQALPAQARFAYRESLSRASLMMDETLDQWLRAIPLAQRQAVCEAVFRVLSAWERGAPAQSALALARAVRGLDADILRLVGGILWRLLSDTVTAEAQAARLVIRDWLK